MAFSAELSELESLYFQHAEGLFALCFLYTGKSGTAFALMRTALCDLCYSEAQWKLAQGGEEGFFRAVHKTCMDYYVKNPRGKQKKRGKEASGSSSGAALPFSLTDPLRSMLRLPVKFKTPLYLCLGLGWNADRAALALGGSPARVEGLVGAALKKLDMPRERAQTILSSVHAGEDAVQRVWDRFLTDRDEQGFEGKQRLRRFKRWLDNAIPYIALGVVALGALAFFGVEYGWFTGVPYSHTAPIEGYEASGYYGNPPASEIEAAAGTLAVYVPEGDAFVKYLVQDTPLSATAAAKQRVYLGGLPEGTSLLSVGAAREDGTELSASPDPADSAVFSLTVEFSREAEDYFAAASPEEGEAMLRAMARTYGELYGGLRQLRFLSGGEELSAGGLTAQDLLDGELPVFRTVETGYRE